MKTKQLHFRVDTPAFLKEITEHGLRDNSGVLFVPLNTFRVLLGEMAQRAAKINDPIMNRIMFDLTLYDLPSPSTKEYGELMDKIYKLAEEQVQKEKQ